ncbi:hypothetical protein M409DRAFT_25031 [Zasmidium cellare ATCC 36951]|uniref:Uncharacterized protein n=1 Tax=Zasmidium cellare ATCC 36951 TaxID=1080233 RepID=A0A6A6CC61_ZASCE|nr:uncharacterized protein M409DRAFT_25031 [Zasmidium cellare ATCC 36951]KAF2164635.1 hypothetical protein M409DRAFT_25031 [Zasmidium cellare ATCC 36951]
MAAYEEVLPAPSGIINSDTRTSFSPGYCPGDATQLKRIPSMRTIIPVQYADSSEDTPSDHSSVFNAVPSSRKTASNDSTQGTGAEKEASQDASTAEPAPGESHTGTRLFTITEQKSVPTLKTMPSNWTFQRRIVTAQPQMAWESARG